MKDRPDVEGVADFLLSIRLYKWLWEYHFVSVSLPAMMACGERFHLCRVLYTGPCYKIPFALLNPILLQD